MTVYFVDDIARLENDLTQVMRQLDALEVWKSWKSGSRDKRPKDRVHAANPIIYIFDYWHTCH